MDRVVPGYGRTPNPVMLVGEAPGREEAYRGQPFVGQSGQDQRMYLSRFDLCPDFWYLTNVVKSYFPDNPDPTPELIDLWTPTLYRELLECAPRVILAVGRFAAQWFLGDLELRRIYGVPHRAGAYDPSLRDRGGPLDAIIVPIYHPAAGIHDPNMRASVYLGYRAAAEVIKTVRANQPVEVPRDPYPHPQYLDVTGTELADQVRGADEIGVDTEWSRYGPWSIQISTLPGTGLVMRTGVEDFDVGIRALQTLADRGCRFIYHNLMADLPMCRRMGLDLDNARLWDSMYAAYLTRLGPQGLKDLSWRYCGMRMDSYQEVIGDAAVGKRLDYLRLVATHPWPPQLSIYEELNNGTFKITKRPQGIGTRAASIIRDVETGKTNKDGEPTDIKARWLKIPDEIRKQAEDEYGSLPNISLDDIPLDQAIYYSARDADATLRIAPYLQEILTRDGITRLMDHGVEILPVFCEMEQTGMPASTAKMIDLFDDMTQKMREHRDDLTFYFDDEPINPKSPVDTRKLLAKRGLQGEETTPTGEVSTSKRSIEHLRYLDPAIGLLFDFREAQHIRDSFCKPILRHSLRRSSGHYEPALQDIHHIKCRIKATRTHTRRLATADPNLLAIPSRTEIGRRVRSCYVAPKGMLLGAWDLSQIEARFLAHETQDPVLMDIFWNDRDIHSETASRIFEVPLDQLSKDQRYVGKTINFGIFYGIQEHGLYIQLLMKGIEGWDKKKCRWAIDRWFETYQKVLEYKVHLSEEVRATGIVRDHWGMLRYLPGIWSRNKGVAAEAGRHALSHRIQGGAQGMIQNSMVWLKYHIRNLQQQGYKVYWLLQIHDEIILLFEQGLEQVLDPLVIHALTEQGGIKLRVPVLADGAVAESWGDL